MYSRWTFFRLNVKRYFKILPVILLETVLSGLLLLGTGAYATKAVYGERVVNKIRVGIVADGEDPMTDMLIGFVESMDSLKDTASFVHLSEEEAGEGLRSGEICAAILVPEGMIDSIISGENIPAQVLLNNTYSKMETEVFMQLTQAGAKLLTTAQAGIYAADAFWLENGRPDKCGNAEDYLNRAYLACALDRAYLFREREVSAVKGVNLTDYYGISLLFAFLSFAGLSFGRYMQVEMGERERIIKSRGIRAGGQYLLEASAFATVFGVLGTVFSVPVCIWLAGKGKSSFEPGGMWVLMPALWFLVGIFIRGLFQLVGNHGGGMGICFVVLMALMTASGVFIPSAFLPSWVEKAGVFIPYGEWMEGMALLLQGRFEGGLAVKFLLMAALFMAAGIAAAVCRENRREK